MELEKLEQPCKGHAQWVGRHMARARFSWARSTTRKWAVPSLKSTARLEIDKSTTREKARNKHTLLVG